MKETRNVLVESARIARGNIKDLSQFKASDFDGVIFPGGFGVARNLSDWAIKGPDCNIIPGVRQAINDFISQGKPIAALCISPVLLAKILKGVEITLGDDPSSIAAVESLGAKHIKTGHREMVIDRKYKTISSPCYMLDAKIDQIGDSAEIVVRELLALM
jgi:enhancing lycopene biosynthesis protein 2